MSEKNSKSIKKPQSNKLPFGIRFPNNSLDSLEIIEKLAELKKLKIITPKEFDEKKKKLLRNV